MDFVEDDELYEHFRMEVDKGQVPVRIDKYLSEHQPHSSRNRIQKAADAGFIHVNGRPVKSNYKVRAGDVVTLMLDRPHYDTTIEPENIPLEVVYEDDDLMVINKPAGMVVHPGCGNFNGTLVNAIAWHLKDLESYDPNDPEVGLVHRIDKDTSGLLVVAKTPDAKTSLGKQFFNKTTHRSYNALVWGNFVEDEGRIEGNIGRDPKDRLRMEVFPPDSEIGKPAVTHYHVMERYGYTTLVECVLETGRTHQIRAHMKHIGHPLFCDERYGGTEILRGERTASYKAYIQNCFKLCPRQVLHAKTLGFVHPTTGEQMDFTSEWPEDMAALIDKQQKRTIAIVCGGDSSEHDVSLRSAQGLYSFFDKERYDIYIVDIKGQDWHVELSDGTTAKIDRNDFSFMENGKARLFDYAYITIHGTPGENGLLQGYFDLIGLPYSTSSVLVEAMTFDKFVLNQYLRGYGVSVADSLLIRKGYEELVSDDEIEQRIGMPCFVKPAADGSSFGVSKVKNKDQLAPAIRKAMMESPEIMVESLLEGTEITQGIYKTREKTVLFPITEVVTSNEFFDYDAKYNGQVQEITPARLPEEVAERVGKITSLIYDVLHCNGIIRIDYIVSKEGKISMLEVNTTPGMTATSFIPQQVRAAGLNMADVLSDIVENQFD